MVTGILALQGDFGAHAEKLKSLGKVSKEVRSLKDFKDVTSLIVPGGESSVLLKLLPADLEQAIVAEIKGGMPALVTCAGLILFASDVKNPEQRSLGLLDIGVVRNAYGRQIDSFIAEDLTLQSPTTGKKKAIEGVFIRAPKIEWVGKEAKVLIERKGEVVGVKQGNVIGLTFHPELCDAGSEVYDVFFSQSGAGH
jgi:5'-phosphate synthase pdxT subunit